MDPALADGFALFRAGTAQVQRVRGGLPAIRERRLRSPYPPYLAACRLCTRGGQGRSHSSRSSFAERPPERVEEVRKQSSKLRAIAGPEESDQRATAERYHQTSAEDPKSRSTQG